MGGANGEKNKGKCDGWKGLGIYLGKGIKLNWNHHRIGEYLMYWIQLQLVSVKEMKVGVY